MLYKIVAIFVCLTTSISQHVSLIGSHLLPIESDYKVYLHGQNLAADTVINVTLESGQEYEKFKVFDDFSRDLAEEIRFEIPTNLPLNYKLSIVQKNKAINSCTKQSLRIQDNSNRRMVLIQLNKPVYKSGDTVKFKTFVMDHKSIPIENEMINVTIFDGNKNSIKKFENVETSKIGVFENSLKIAESPNLGKWLIKVDLDGKSKSKNFQVLHYDEENFQILVTSLDKEVSFVNKYVFLDIQAKHPNDKIFNGIARISSTVRDKNNRIVFNKRSIKDVMLPMSSSVVSISIENDLGIRSPNSDMILEFAIEVVEHKTQRSEKMSLSIPMRYKRKHNLSVFRDTYFKPGFHFSMTVQINDLNGQPDKSLNALKIVIDYESLDPDTHISTTDKQTFEKIAENGEVEVVLHPKVNTQKIKVYLEIAGTELIETIKSIHDTGVDEYMVADILNKENFYNISQTLQISVRSNNQLDTLHVLVFGSNGLLHSKEYPDAKLSQTFKFNLELTEEMTPICHVLMFYVRQDDGLIVYDDLSISFNYYSNNSLTLAPDQKVKPNQMVNLKFKGPIGSFVFLSAIDRNYASVSTRNEVSRSNMYREAVQYMNQKFSNISTYQFNRFNAFVMQPGRSCDEEDIEEVPKEVTDESDAEELTQKYFPDVWFDEIVEIKTNGIQSLQKQLPSAFTSWRIIGASIHTTKGFVVGNAVREVKVEPEIALKVHTPAMMHEGEVLKVEFGVYNFLDNAQSSQITVTIENGDLMNEKLTKKWIWSKIWCKSYIHSNQNSMQLSLQLPGSSMSKFQDFFVQPTNLGEMKVKITGTAGNVQDSVEKVVKILSRRRLKKSVAETHLIDLEGNGSLDKKINLNLSPNEELANVYATLSGNLIGPVLNEEDKKSHQLRDHPDYKALKFASSIIRAKYLQFRNQIVPDDLIDEMLKGYQEAIAVLQSENLVQNSFLLSALIDAKNFIKIDDYVIEMVLDKFKSKQNADGSFTVGLGAPEKFILTAQATLAFIKYQKHSDKYQEVVTKAIKYQKSIKAQLVNDYEKVAVAYIIAKSGDKEFSKLITSSLQNLFLNAAKTDSKMSSYIETAAYLIKLKIINNNDPKTEVEWLLKQRKPCGRFFSPRDTLLALYALAAYSRFKNSAQTNLSFKIDNKVDTLVNGNDGKYMNLPKQNQHNLNVNGQGLGYVTVNYEYYQKSAQYQHKNFLMSVGTKELSEDKLELAIDVKLIAAGISKTNLVMVEVEMPSGYEYYGHNNNDGNIKMIEHKNNRTLTVLYVDAMEVNKMYKVVMQAVKVYQIEKSAKSAIKVYDFYQSNVRDEIEYDFDKNTRQCS